MHRVQWTWHLLSVPSQFIKVLVHYGVFFQSVIRRVSTPRNAPRRSMSISTHNTGVPWLTTASHQVQRSAHFHKHGKHGEQWLRWWYFTPLRLSAYEAQEEETPWNVGTWSLDGEGEAWWISSPCQKPVFLRGQVPPVLPDDPTGVPWPSRAYQRWHFKTEHKFSQSNWNRGTTIDLLEDAHSATNILLNIFFLITVPIVVESLIAETRVPFHSSYELDISFVLIFSRRHVLLSTTGRKWSSHVHQVHIGPPLVHVKPKLPFHWSVWFNASKSTLRITPRKEIFFIGRNSRRNRPKITLLWT